MKRLLCDCSLVAVAEDPTGQPLDVGRKQRTSRLRSSARCTRAIAVARFRVVIASAISTGIIWNIGSTAAKPARIT